MAMPPATVFTGSQGTHRFKSNFPHSHAVGPEHLHLRVTAPDHRELITRHRPQPGSETGRSELMLLPADELSPPD